MLEIKKMWPMQHWDSATCSYTIQSLIRLSPWSQEWRPNRRVFFPLKPDDDHDDDYSDQEFRQFWPFLTPSLCNVMSMHLVVLCFAADRVVVVLPKLQVAIINFVILMIMIVRNDKKMVKWKSHQKHSQYCPGLGEQMLHMRAAAEDERNIVMKIIIVRIIVMKLIIMMKIIIVSNIVIKRIEIIMIRVNMVIIRGVSLVDPSQVNWLELVYLLTETKPKRWQAD